ncbi:MAG: hypothetical protein PHR51_00200 [Patescibacteria group bacterium]|nr:hypothetical protein [Patescibacteria group bacterium]
MVVTSNVKTRYRKIRKARVCQGDILNGLSFLIYNAKNPKKYASVDLQYAVVLTQECDLDLDYKLRRDKPDQHDKHLQTILICPAYLSTDLCNGKHLEGRTMSPVDLKKLKKGDLKRYHLLNEDLSLSIPELVIDFKHFFTVPRGFLYSQRKSCYIATMNEIFRESLSQRFAFYLSRIAEPEVKK